MHNDKITIHRPCSLVCLGIIAILFIQTRLQGRPEAGYPADAFCKIQLIGTVRQKEGSTEALKILLQLPGIPRGKPDQVICYLSPEEQEPEIGSTIKIKGYRRAFEEATNPGQFDSFFYYQILGISYSLFQAEILEKTTSYDGFRERLYQCRQFLGELLESSLPAEDAAVMRTMLLGEKGLMDKELKALYQRNGIAHILAISGLHISLIGMGLFRLLRKIGMPSLLAGILSMLFLLVYGTLIGFSATAVRAIIMFCLNILARIYRRTYDGLTALSIAAILLLLEQPLYLYHSGFIFSFGCILGIYLIQPALTTRKKNGSSSRKQVHWLLKSLLGSMTMTVITLPVYLWFYYQVPVYSMVLNLLIIPLMSLLMAAGILLLAIGEFCSAGTVPVGWFISGVLEVYEKTCCICQELPLHLLTPGRPKLWQVLCYVFILCALIPLKRKLSLGCRWMLVCCGIVILLLRPEKGVELTFLDVGQGDCIFIQNGREGCYLVDGGSSSVAQAGTYRILPFLKYKGAAVLDAVFVTHADADHCNGIMELLENGKTEGILIKNLILPETDEKIRFSKYNRLIEMAENQGIAVQLISRGQRIQSGSMTFTCLYPEAGVGIENSNEHSTVLLLEYEEFRALLTGDLEGEGEKSVLHYLENINPTNDIRSTMPGRISVLKVAHHGSRNSTGQELLDRMRPACSVISYGNNNSYGHPHEETLNRLEKAESRIFQTGEDGAVTMTVLEDRVKISCFNNIKTGSFIDKKFSCAYN